MINYNSSNILKALLLLILGMSSNFLGSTLGCQFQKFLKNRYVKELFLLCLIYFTIDFTQYENRIIHPLKNLLLSLGIWGFFLSFTHLDLIPSLIVLTLIMSLYYIHSLRDYYSKLIKTTNNNNNELSNKDKKLEKVEGILTTIIICLCAIFSIKYFFEKKKEDKSKFRLSKFIFGVNKCKEYTPKSAKLF